MASATRSTWPGRTAVTSRSSSRMSSSSTVWRPAVSSSTVSVPAARAAAPALLAKVARELGGGGRLARAVETDEHDDDGRRPAEVERRGRAAERLDQLAVDQLDEVLLRREAAEHLLAEGVAFDRLDEVADDADVDVGLEKREPHVAERVFDVALRDPPLALQLAEERVELLAEGFEHQERAAVREELTVTGG